MRPVAYPTSTSVLPSRPGSNLRGSERLLLPSAAGHIHLSHTHATLIAPVRVLTQRPRRQQNRAAGTHSAPAPMRPVAFPYQTPATSLPTGHSHLPHVSSCTRRVGAFSTGQRGLTPPGTQNVCVCIQSRSPQVRPDSNLRGSERLLLPSAAGHIHLSHTRATLIAPVRTHRDRTFSTQGSGGSRRPAPRIKYVCVQSRSPTRHARDSSNR
jgi:hypothetical protein